MLVVLFGSRSGENLNVLLSTRSHTLRTYVSTSWFCERFGRRSRSFSSLVVSPDKVGLRPGGESGDEGFLTMVHRVQLLCPAARWTTRVLHQLCPRPKPHRTLTRVSFLPRHQPGSNREKRRSAVQRSTSLRYRKGWSTDILCYSLRRSRPADRHDPDTVLDDPASLLGTVNDARHAGGLLQSGLLNTGAPFYLVLESASYA